MTINTNELVAAVVTVAMDGTLEILNRVPFAAKIDTSGAPLFVVAHLFESTNTTIVELSIPVARVTPSPVLDRWIVRAAPQLFNVHVAARDSDQGMIVEARSSLLAYGLTVAILDRSMALLTVGAARLTDELRGVLAQEAMSPPVHSVPVGASVPTGTLQSESDAGQVVAPVAFAGYL